MANSIDDILVEFTDKVKDLLWDRLKKLYYMVHMQGEIILIILMCILYIEELIVRIKHRKNVLFNCLFDNVWK